MNDSDVEQRLKTLGDSFAIDEAAEKSLYEAKKIKYSVMVSHFSKDLKSVAAAEHAARASPEYQEAVDNYIKAKLKSGLSKSALEAIKIRFDYWRSKESTSREEMKQGIFK